ncbi:maf protein [Magnetococcus marinus MC-1]|uniref:7-methyl-GTP pyrophosphatase n=1 Tax=Magnetococcus marinus (strain ATCC BAA-1437 / JCM 17883 / MC-1) TaxID=156889 RepID=A0L4Y2_MAGMM|nr:nucleoside triphosphate pyrophosphatase [Magnetococcus marinus]ABK43025.1 maf protein [Magnetococcus marinus MC-1]
MVQTELILASTSPYRAELLGRLRLPFRQQAPQCAEAALAGELPAAMAGRLATCKAQAVAAGLQDGLVIGSDQVATLDGVTAVGKPGDFEQALAQLEAASGRSVTFYTGVTVLDVASGRMQRAVEPFQVVFRPLSRAQISRYLALEQPYDCAGSFKVEGLGIVLFERLVGEDPTALMGLPLIRLTRMLEAMGVAPLGGELVS